MRKGSKGGMVGCSCETAWTKKEGNGRRKGKRRGRTGGGDGLGGGHASEQVQHRVAHRLAQLVVVHGRLGLTAHLTHTQREREQTGQHNVVYREMAAMARGFRKERLAAPQMHQSFPSF